MLNINVEDFIKPDGVEEYDNYPMPDPDEVAKMSDKEKAEFLKSAKEQFRLLKEKA